MDNTITNKASHGKLLDYISPEIIIPITMIYFAVIYSLRFSWYLGGAIMLIMPVIEYAAIIINSIKRKRKLILPASYIVIAYFTYITIRHVFSLDILTMGVSDAVISAFALTCMQAQKKEEFIRIFYRVCMTFMWISIISGILSLLTLLIPESIKTDTVLPEFIRTNIQNKFTTRTNNGLSRLIGIYPHPNTTAHYCVYGLMFGFGTVLSKPEKISNYMFFGMDLILTAIILILTESRASMLSVAVFFILTTIIYFTYLRKHLNGNSIIIDSILMLFIVIAICMILSFMIFDSVRAKVLEILRVPYSNDMTLLDSFSMMIEKFRSASGRDNLRTATIEAWKNNILFGISSSEIVQLLKPLDSSIRFSNSSHNAYIQILSTTGLIGLALFLVLQISAILSLSFAIKKTKDRLIKVITIFMMIMIIVAIVDNQFEVYYYSNIYTAVLVNFYALATGFQAGKIIKDEKKCMK